MASWVRVVRVAPDRLSIALCFIAFGIWSAIQVATAPNFSGLHVVFLIFDVEFAAVGVIMVINLRRDLVGWHPLAHTLIAAAMGMLGVVLLIISQSPFGLLSLAFALQALSTARFLRRQDEMAKRVRGLIEQDMQR